MLSLARQDTVDGANGGIFYCSGHKDVTLKTEKPLQHKAFRGMCVRLEIR